MATFRELAQLGEELEATRSRKAMSALVADFLETLPPDQIAPAVRMIVGRVFPERAGRPLGLSGAAVWRVVNSVAATTAAQRQAIAGEASDVGQSVQMMLELATRSNALVEELSLEDVWRTFQQIAAAEGKGSRESKDHLLRDLFERASPLEAKYLAKLAVGEMRHGMSEGLMLDAISRAARVPRSLVSKANMLRGDLGEVAQIALCEGSEGLQRSGIVLGRPIKPMLAQSASSTEEAFQLLSSKLALEYKLDGARVQIHKDGSTVWLFSRHLADMTASLPEVREEISRGIEASTAVLEGEVIAIAHDGRPLPFQQLMRRLRRVHDLDAMGARVPLKLYLFDVLYSEGELWLHQPYRRRVQALQELHGDIALAERLVPTSPQEGQAFLQAALDAGHEGLMAKALDSPYSPGVRGRHWLKIKPAMTLDLAIVAADWGYGRRHGWLSNYHLAARDEVSGELRLVGKTFKGLTDEEFRQMTKRLLSLRTAEEPGTVFVRPEVVVEVAFNNVQHSRQYSSGVALRFARIVRIRADKPVADVDTIQTLRALRGTGSNAAASSRMERG